MKPGLTLIVLVLDKSGSMQTCKAATISGVNEFVNDQRRQPGEAEIVFTQFDTEVTHLSKRRVQDFPVLGSPDLPYLPDGMTALYDAVGSTIISVLDHVAATPEDERPERVLFVVQTDGQENSSHEFDSHKVRKLVVGQEAQNWKFLFLGADQDAWIQGERMGMANTVSYNAAETAATFTMVSHDTRQYRESGTIPVGARDLRVKPPEPEPPKPQTT